MHCLYKSYTYKRKLKAQSKVYSYATTGTIYQYYSNANYGHSQQI